MGGNGQVDRITGSISDGKPVDWDRIEVDADLDADTAEAMRDVARIADFNRALQTTAEAPPGTSASPDPLTPPFERWRDLTLLEPIGAGARGEVWRAWDATLQRQVALKFLQPTGTSQGDREDSADLLNEARALARVRHPGIVTVYGIAEDQGRHGMWMECVPGVTLAREIERVGPLPARQVLQIGVQLCSALEALEAAELVHRDIKPANILLEGAARVLLTDFGLGWRQALVDEATPKSSGTPMFLAPEILAGGTPTHRSDLYSLGVTLWWALAGQPPFEARTIGELRAEVLRGPARTLATLRPDAPRDLVDAILWAMNPSSSERPRSAAELGGRLQTTAVESGSAVSIGVLPFANRSPGDEDEYLAEGLADELGSILGKIRGIRVAARTSASRFRDRQATIEEMGRALRVETILDGNIRRAGDRLRVSVQVVSVGDGLQLWSQTYDRTVDDIFAVQDDIARSAAQELRAALLGKELNSTEQRSVAAEVARAARGGTADPEAHRLRLLARHLIHRLNREDLTRAIDYLKQALEVDPEFAQAWADLASAYVRAATWGPLPAEEATRRARESVDRALALEPDLAEAHARLGVIQMFHEWDWDGAEASCTRALALAPGDSIALNTAGVMAMILGRPEPSISFHRRAAEQDPLNAAPYSNLGVTLYRAGRYDEAEAALRQSLEIAPQRNLTRGTLGMVLARQGRAEEALAEVGREPDEGQRLFASAVVHHAVGNTEGVESSLRDLVTRHGEHYAIQVAEVYALRGEVAAALDWLERAYAQRDFGIMEVRTIRSFDVLHGDPRWKALMSRLRFDGSPP